jgi:hypothetical protein
LLVLRFETFFDRKITFFDRKITFFDRKSTCWWSKIPVIPANLPIGNTSLGPLVKEEIENAQTVQKPKLTFISNKARYCLSMYY